MTIFVGAPRRNRRASVVGGTIPRLPLRLVKGVVLAAVCAAVLVPFLAVVSTSIAGRQEISAAGGFVLWPSHPTLQAYRAILSGGVVAHALVVSVLITVIGTAMSLGATTMLAYGLSRPGSFAHKPVLLVVLFAVLFTPGIIPSYLMVKELGLINSYWSLILPSLINAFNVIILRAFIMELPTEMIEAAKIDGATETQVLWRIVLPLTRAAQAVIGLFYAVGYWNSFFQALLYINDSAKWPLPLVLRTYVIDNAKIGAQQVGANVGPLPPPQSLQMAILVISIVPIVLVYPFLQRHFAKGVLVGAVKA